MVLNESLNRTNRSRVAYFHALPRVFRLPQPFLFNRFSVLFQNNDLSMN